MINLEVDYNGKNYKGYYEVDKGIISVRCGMFHKNTQLNSSLPEVLARMIIIEIIKENNL